MEIRVLSSDDVQKALPMVEAIEGMKRAYSRLSTGRVEMPLRSRVHVPEQGGVLLTMPAALPDDSEMAVKLGNCIWQKSSPWISPDSCCRACVGYRKRSNQSPDGWRSFDCSSYWSWSRSRYRIACVYGCGFCRNNRQRKTGLFTTGCCLYCSQNSASVGL